MEWGKCGEKNMCEDGCVTVGPLASTLRTMQTLCTIFHSPIVTIPTLTHLTG